MKAFRLFIALALVCGLLIGLPLSAQAKPDDLLTLDRVIQVSDTEIVLEFSEPVALNKFLTNRGPYAAIRWVNTSNGVGYTLNEYGVNGDAMQWTGDLSYIGDDHSKLLWKINTSRLGCSTIEQARQINTADALRSIEKNKLRLRFVLEEVPYDEKALAADGKVINVTNKDGDKYLFPTQPNGWESCILDIEKNYNYPLDRSSIRGVNSSSQNWDFDVIWHGEGLAVEETETESVEVIRELQNDPKTVALIFGADLLIAIVAIIVVVLIKKKRKAA